MANSSIPNSTPATGRTSTTSSKPSRKRNNRAHVSGIQPSVLNACARFSGICGASCVRKRRQVRHGESALWRTGALQSALCLRKIPRWMLDVRRSPFSSFRRVKGAWWPSRSSKPSSPRKWLGRFDSYPLRFYRFDGRRLRFDFDFNFVCGFKSNIKLRTSNIEGGGDLDVARANP